MILSIPPYEADETEERQKVSYLSGRDFKILAIGVVVLMGLMTPVYLMLKKGRDKHVCTQNLKAIGYALQLYSIDNTDRLPPIYGTDDGVTPRLYNGTPLTWMSVIADRLGGKTNFECPSATSEENTKSLNPGVPHIKGPLTGSYGMYGAWSAFPRSYLSSPAESVLVTETANHGARDTYNPLPFGDKAKHPYDGFIVGLNSTNFPPADSGDQRPLESATFATRLAFYGTKSGNFPVGTPGRHGDTIQALNGDLSLMQLLPAQVKVSRIGKGADLTGTWRVR